MDVTQTASSTELALYIVKPLECKGYYNATSNNMKLAHWPLMCATPASPVLAASNVTAHPFPASVPITVLLYNGSLPCSFNMYVKGLTCNSNISQ